VRTALALFPSAAISEDDSRYLPRAEVDPVIAFVGKEHSLPHRQAALAWVAFSSRSIFSIEKRKAESLAMRRAIRLCACITVEWSRPKASPIAGNELSVILRHRYIATCRQKAMCCVRFFDLRSASRIWKKSATVFWIAWISGFISCVRIKSRNACRAKSLVMADLLIEASADTRVRQPSSSRTLADTFCAM
jgi:hypothetical protein